VEEEGSGVDGSVAAEKGERDSCDVRGGASLDTGSSKVRAGFARSYAEPGKF
jgi:hypothetical protein